MMPRLEMIRGVMYAIGLVGAIGVMASAVRINHLLARLLGLIMFGWAVHCVIALSYVIIVAHALIGPGGYDAEFPAWHMALRSIDAVLLAGIPIALFIALWWEGRNGNIPT